MYTPSPYTTLFRSRRRDPVLARGRAARLPRLRRGHLARPLVPRPDRDPHPRLGGRRGERGPLVLVRGELRVLRGEQGRAARCRRSEEQTSELQSLMRISYAVFCLKKKKEQKS